MSQAFETRHVHVGKHSKLTTMLMVVIADSHAIDVVQNLLFDLLPLLCRQGCTVFHCIEHRAAQLLFGRQSSEHCLASTVASAAEQSASQVV
jgi:hypothetical protein